MPHLRPNGREPSDACGEGKNCQNSGNCSKHDRRVSGLTMLRQEKPWGYELLLVRTERYAGKLLCVRGGERLSLQHHAVKDETLFLINGEAELDLERSAGECVCLRMTADQSYRVRPGQKHRLRAISDATVLEISTPELDDVERWADDYGRTAGDSGGGL